MKTTNYQIMNTTIFQRHESHHHNHQLPKYEYENHKLNYLQPNTHEQT